MAEILNAAPWGITDPNGYVLFPLPTKASADLNAPADADVEVDLYKDAGAGHFVTATGWTHLFTLVYTDTTGNGKGYAMGYSNNLGDFRTHKNSGWPGCCLLLQSDGGGMVDVEALTDGGNTGGGGVAGMFDENVVVYGKTIVDAANFTVEFYSDAARTNLIGSDTVPHGAGEPVSYQYLHAMTNEDRGSTGREWGFDIYDIDLQEGPPTFVTATLQSSAGVALPDGITVREYDSATGAATGNSGPTSGGTGSVSIQHPSGDAGSYYLVPDPTDVGMGGETLCTGLIVPV